MTQTLKNILVNKPIIIIQFCGFFFSSSPYIPATTQPLRLCFHSGACLSFGEKKKKYQIMTLTQQ